MRLKKDDSFSYLEVEKKLNEYRTRCGFPSGYTVNFKLAYRING